VAQRAASRGQPAHVRFHCLIVTTRHSEAN
jgi:hypothetical protein